MKQKELGEMFVEAGGPVSDKKKPKLWLIAQESPHFENGVISRLFGPHAGRKEGPKVPH